MKGLGDNIYCRALVKQIGMAYVDTPWPELYEDLPVKFCQSRTALRTQAKNLARQPQGRFERYPGGEIKSIKYGREGIIPGMEDCFGVEFKSIDLPSFNESPVDGRYAVIRPATLRSEWKATSRNPNPDYICEAAEELRKKGITVVSVADLEDGKEWIVGEEPYSDIKFHKGELNVKQLLSLVENSWLVVGGVGWIVPACIAYNVESWIIYGGYGSYNHPEKLTHPLMDLSKQHYILPDNFCLCDSREHVCGKKITGHRDKFRAYLASRGWDRVSSKRADDV
jgi:hypothetical protein